MSVAVTLPRAGGHRAGQAEVGVDDALLDEDSVLDGAGSFFGSADDESEPLLDDDRLLVEDLPRLSVL